MLSQKKRPYQGSSKLDSLTDVKDVSTTTPIRKIRINNRPKFLLDKFFEQKRKKALEKNKRKSQGGSSIGLKNTSSICTREIDERLASAAKKRGGKFSSFRIAPNEEDKLRHRNRQRQSLHVSKFQHGGVMEEEGNPPNYKPLLYSNLNDKNHKIGPCSPLVMIQSKNNFNESMPITISDFSKTINFNNRPSEKAYSKSSFNKKSRRPSMRIDGVVRVVEESLNESKKSRSRNRYRNCKSMNMNKKGILKERSKSKNKKFVKNGTKVSFSRKKKVFKYNPNHKIESRISKRRRARSEAAISRKSYGNTSNLGDLSILGGLGGN